MNKMITNDFNVAAGSLSHVQETTESLRITSDVLRHDSNEIVRTANNLNSDVIKHDLQAISTSASSLADMLRNPHLYN